MSEGSLLDNDAYSAPPVFQAERRRIFGTGWHVIGPVAGFAEAGAYAALGLGGWALLAMRDADGTIRAFQNVCAHQKMPVVDNGRGRCEQLRCRYHGWTYNAKGRLISAPAPVSPGDDLDDYGLEPLPATTLRGLVFASFDEEMEEQPVPDADFADLDALTLVADDMRSIAPNWKAVLDAIHGGVAAPPLSAAGRFAWIQPTTGLWQEPEGTVLLLVVPRTFRKTELHLFALAPDDSGADQLSERIAEWADRITEAATARQAAVEAGTTPDADLAARLRPIHGWIARALVENA